MSANLSVVTIEDEIFWHTRKGLSKDKKNQTIFKKSGYALRVAKKKYSKELGKTLKSWKVSEL